MNSSQSRNNFDVYIIKGNQFWACHDMPLHPILYQAKIFNLINSNIARIYLIEHCTCMWKYNERKLTTWYDNVKWIKIFNIQMIWPPYCLSLETCNCSFGNGQEEGRQPCGYSGTRLAPGSHGSPCWNVALGRRHLRGPSWWSWTVPWILLEIPGFPKTN